MEAGYDLYEIFDQKEHTFKLGQDIFDFEVDDIQEDIKEYYDHDFFAIKYLYSRTYRDFTRIPL